jgi:hypothetical protein
MKIKAKQIDTTGGLKIEGATVNRIMRVDGDGALQSADLLKYDAVNNRLGIGTATPTSTVDITGDTDGEAQLQIRQHNNSADGPDLSFYRSRGTESSKAVLSASDNVGRVNAASWTGSAYERTGSYGWTASDGAGNSTFSLTTRSSGTEADRLAVTSTGAVKISDAYTLPTSDGTSGQVLSTDGSGALSFATVSGGASDLNGLSDVDTTGLTDQDVLVYESSSSTWKPKPASAPVAIPLGYPAALTDSGVNYTPLLCAGSESSKGFVMPFSGRLIAMGAGAEVTNTDTNNYLRFRPTINGSGSSSRDIEITVGSLGYIKGHFDFTDITFSAGDQLSVMIIHNNNGATTENHHALLIVEYDR